MMEQTDLKDPEQEKSAKALVEFKLHELKRIKNDAILEDADPVKIARMEVEIALLEMDRGEVLKSASNLQSAINFIMKAFPPPNARVNESKQASPCDDCAIATTRRGKAWCTHGGYIDIFKAPKSGCDGIKYHVPKQHVPAEFDPNKPMDRFDYPPITCPKCGKDNQGSDPTRVARMAQGIIDIYNCRCGYQWNASDENNESIIQKMENC